jgi:hypothetical protein
MTFAGVVDGEAFLTEGAEEGLDAWDDGADGADIVTLALEIAFRRAD